FFFAADFFALFRGRAEPDEFFAGPARVCRPARAEPVEAPCFFAPDLFAMGVVFFVRAGFFSARAELFSSRAELFSACAELFSARAELFSARAEPVEAPAELPIFKPGPSTGSGRTG